MGDFVVESNGRCFFCFKQSSTPFQPECKSGDVRAPGTYSIQYLSRYLKLDMGKVFHEDGTSIPVDLLEKSKLNVELCDECELWNGRFSKLYKQLEKIKMEMASCAKPIVDKLKKSSKDNLFCFADLELINLGKLQVLKALRVETMQKLSLKLSRTGPRVRVHNLLMRELQPKMLKRKKRKRRSRRKQAILSHPPPSNFINAEQNTPTEEPVDIVADLKMESVSTQPVLADDPSISNDFNCEQRDSEQLHSASGNNDNDDDVPVITGCISVKRDATDNEIGKELTDGNGNFSQEAEVPPEEETAAFKDKYAFNRRTRRWICRSCPKQYSTHSGFLHHYKSVHMEIKHKCSLCEKTYKSAFSYKRHQKTVHKGAQFTCSICNRHFVLEYHLLRHRQTCGNSDPNPGPVIVLGQTPESSGRARKQKRGRSMLGQSLEDSGMSKCVINPENGKLKCTLCGKELSRKSHYQRHYYRIHLRGRFQCGLCSKSFARKESLQAHLRVPHLKGRVRKGSHPKK